VLDINEEFSVNCSNDSLVSDDLVQDLNDGIVHGKDLEHVVFHSGYKCMKKTEFRISLFNLFDALSYVEEDDFGAEIMAVSNMERGDC